MATIPSPFLLQPETSSLQSTPKDLDLRPLFSISCFCHQKNSSDDYSVPCFINVGISSDIQAPKSVFKSKIESKPVIQIIDDTKAPPKLPNIPRQDPSPFALDPNGYSIPYYLYPNWQKSKEFSGLDCVVFFIFFGFDRDVLKQKPTIYHNLFVQTALEACAENFQIEISKKHKTQVASDFVWFSHSDQLKELVDYSSKVRKSTTLDMFSCEPKKMEFSHPYWTHNVKYKVIEHFTDSSSDILSGYIHAHKTNSNPIASYQSHKVSSSSPKSHSHSLPNKSKNWIFIDGQGKLSKKPPQNTSALTQPTVSQDSSSLSLPKKPLNPNQFHSIDSNNMAPQLFCHFEAPPQTFQQAETNFKNLFNRKIDPEKAHWPSHLVYQFQLDSLRKVFPKNLDARSKWVTEMIDIVLIAGHTLLFKSSKPKDDNDTFGYHPLHISLEYPVPYSPFSSWYDSKTHQLLRPIRDSHFQVFFHPEKCQLDVMLLIDRFESVDHCHNHSHGDSHGDSLVGEEQKTHHPKSNLSNDSNNLKGAQNQSHLENNESNSDTSNQTNSLQACPEFVSSPKFFQYDNCPIKFSQSISDTNHIILSPYLTQDASIHKKTGLPVSIIGCSYYHPTIPIAAQKVFCHIFVFTLSGEKTTTPRISFLPVRCTIKFKHPTTKVFHSHFPSLHPLFTQIALAESKPQSPCIIPILTTSVKFGVSSCIFYSLPFQFQLTRVTLDRNIRINLHS